MLTPQKLGKKIKLLRENKGWSQEELAKKMKYSRSTITNIESGKRDLEALELVKFAGIFGIEPSEFLREEGPAAATAKKTAPKAEFKFDPVKLKNIILYILEKCGGKPNVGETVLYKLLYFSDFDNYELNGRPVTGMNYVRLQFGPVPCVKEYNPVVEQMTEKRELKIITQDYYGMIQKRYIALIDADKSLLAEAEKNIINEVISKYSDMSARGIENYVHGDAPWKETEENNFINYNLVFNRVPPYAHENYDIDFAQAGASDVIKELGEMSEEERKYYQKL
jgi:transcriptional regulator with XRE-family HTH domain